MLNAKGFTKATGSTLLTILSLLLLLGPLTGTALAGQDKVAVCHLNGDGNYIPITIADPALDAHLAHGDKVVGVDVDENCQPLVTDADGDGVADTEDNCLDMANPGQEDRYGTTAGDACEDLDGDGTLDVNEANFCLSIDGVLLESQGTAECYSTATTGQAPNVAVANGHVAVAYAAVDGDGNPAMGSNNRATAVGDGAYARAGAGDNNSAAAIGENAEAVAVNGNNNTATATGADAQAHSANGNSNIATATGDGAFAAAHIGSNNTATATGAGAQARAQFGNNNSATSTGVYTCAGNGDDGETAVNEDLCSN